jgi:RND family efflux transporter MFP subunit
MGAWVAAGAVLAGACEQAQPVETEAAAPAVVEIGPENLVPVVSGEIRTGPLVSGVLRPEREATVRAQVGGEVHAATRLEGQAVTAGTTLARIDQRTLRDAVGSSESEVRSAQNSLDWSRRELQRTESLVAAGALPDRDVELARNAVTGAEAALEAAKARLANVQRELTDTTVVSPITGVISRKHASTGDVVSPGGEIYTIIDPSSMRLEASVPSNELDAVKVGATVVFEVRGYPGQAFEGRIERISPVADEVTRQVPIFVSIPNKGGQLLAGLFAEGRVTREVRTGLIVPETAVNEAGGAPWVLRLRDGRVERQAVTLGLRDAQSEQVEIVSGLSEGDRLLTGAFQGMTPGTAVRVREGTAPGTT